jgi:hypothetical protein
MHDESDVDEDLPLDTFIREIADCGFDWVKRIGHVNVHIFEHRATKQVLPITVNRGMVAAAYVKQARKICRELRGKQGPAV